MKVELRFVLLFCGFALILAFIALLLVPSFANVRARQVDLRILESRARMALLTDMSGNEYGGQLHVLSRDEFFTSLAHIRTAASGHGLGVAAFAASEADSFGLDVSETTVTLTLTGGFDAVVEYIYYLAGGVYNVRYFSIVNAADGQFYVWISIFHEF